MKRERSARLIAECRAVQSEALSEVITLGEPLPVILETRKGSLLSGHSDSYIEVVCESKKDRRGELVFVKPLRQENGVIWGEILENDN